MGATAARLAWGAWRPTQTCGAARLRGGSTAGGRGAVPPRKGVWAIEFFAALLVLVLVQVCGAD